MVRVRVPPYGPTLLPSVGSYEVPVPGARDSETRAWLACATACDLSLVATREGTVSTAEVLPLAWWRGKTFSILWRPGAPYPGDPPHPARWRCALKLAAVTASSSLSVYTNVQAGEKEATRAITEMLRARRISLVLTRLGRLGGSLTKHG